MGNREIQINNLCELYFRQMNFLAQTVRCDFDVDKTSSWLFFFMYFTQMLFFILQLMYKSKTRFYR